MPAKFKPKPGGSKAGQAWDWQKARVPLLEEAAEGRVEWPVAAQRSECGVQWAGALSALDVEVLWWLAKKRKVRDQDNVEVLRRERPVPANREEPFPQECLLANVVDKLCRRYQLYYTNTRDHVRGMAKRGLVRLERSNPEKPRSDVLVFVTGRGWDLLAGLVGPEKLSARGTLQEEVRRVRRRRRAFKARLEEAAVKGDIDLSVGKDGAEKVVQGPSAVGKVRTAALRGALAKALKQEGDDGRVRMKRDETETDPVKWVEAVGWQISTKDKGLVPFVPFPFQRQLMRMAVDSGQRVIIPKTRQIGVTTTLMSAAAFALVNKKPWQMHVVANLEEVARERCLKIVRTGFKHAHVPKAVLKDLSLGGEKTREIRYQAFGWTNYIRAHAGTAGVGRSFDGNVVLMDEMAYMEYADEVYAGLAGMLDNPDTSLWMVSTYNGDGDTFCYCVDNAEALGYEVVPMDWRVRPDRDENWQEQTRQKFLTQEQYEQEHELKRLVHGEAAVDWAALLAFQADEEWIGTGPKTGHRYTKGLDLSSIARARTCMCVVDMTVRPGQVVALEVIEPVITEDATKRMEQQRVAIERLDRMYPGPLFIDGTIEKSLVGMINVPLKQPVHFTGGSSINRDFDKIDRMPWLRVPRTILIDNAAMMVNTGKVVVHERQYGQLARGLGSLRKEGNKKRGKFVDETDAFLLACLGLMRRGTLEAGHLDQSEVRFRTVKNTGGMSKSQRTQFGPTGGGIGRKGKKW
jgi:hypothetical protein